MIGITALLLLAISAQTAPDRNCTDGRGVDRCAEAQQGRSRALLGVRTIEAHRDAGDQVRRVSYVDGNGYDVIVIAFVRAPGRDPAVFVHFPRHDGRPAPEPIQAAVPYEVWTEMLTRSAHFDRSFVPLPAGQGEPDICLHPWIYTVESTDPARANLRPAALRRKTENACADGPAEAFAMDAQRLALPLFPYCARLDPQRFPNPATRLGACRLLRGDRMAAAEVLNRLGAFHARESQDVVNLAGIFTRDARIEWHGRPSPGRGGAAAFWLSGVAEASRANFFYEVVEGLAADRVRVTGALWRYTGGENGVPAIHYAAPVEQIWVFGPAQQFEIVSATIGPWGVQQPY
jgi:hypothetical protein